MRPEPLFRPAPPLIKRLVGACILSLGILHTPLTLMAEELSGDMARSSKLEATNFGQKSNSAPNPSKLLSDLKQYLGIRYLFGGDSPAGFDCSGFVRFIFNKQLNIELPHSSRAMSTMGARVERSELRPGDLVFFKTSGERINHVGIFLGNDTFIHASLSRGIARDKLDATYFRKRYVTAVRIVDMQSDQLPAEFEIDANAIELNNSHS